MAKVTIEFETLEEARSVIDALATRSDAPTATSAAPAEPVVAATTRTAEPAPEGTPDVDVHGMPWDEEIHASTRGLNADGSWKARKGKAQEAKDAVAAFKAAGGSVTPPADVTPPAAPAGMPGAMPVAAPAAPVGMPAAAARADMPPPVTQAALEERIVGALSNGLMSMDDYGNLLDKHGIDRANPVPQLATNETLRAALFADVPAAD